LPVDFDVAQILHLQPASKSLRATFVLSVSSW
jgi:hypothetical protein